MNLALSSRQGQTGMGAIAKRLLLATGDDGFRELARACLHRTGCELVTAGQLDEAIRLVLSQAFHLVVLDGALGPQQLPELVFGVRAAGHRVPIVVCTHNDHALAEQVMGAGASAVWQQWPAPDCLPAMTRCLVASQTASGGAPGMLSVGQTLWLDLHEAVCTGTFPSTLIAFQGAALAVSAPVAGGLPVPVPTGAVIDVGFGRPQGWFQFSSQVIATTFHRKLACLLITQPEMLSHLERRRHSRVSASQPCCFRVGDEEHMGQLRDLSRGGLQAVLEHPLAIGATFIWELDTLQARARCVWVRSVGGNHLVGAAFEPLPAPGEFARLAGGGGRHP